MRLLYNKNQKTRIELFPVKKGTVSSLLIPEKLEKEIKLKFGDDYKVFGVLRYLLNKYRKFVASGEIPNSKKFKLRYQKEGLNLRVKKFRPGNKDWMELGILAYGLGSSRCWLFSYLLELEFSLMGDFLELPEMKDALTTLTNSTPKKIWQFTDQNTTFQRVLHFRE